MRESRTYGSGRGACHETHVPTATEAASSSRCSAARRRRGRLRRGRSSRADAVIGVLMAQLAATQRPDRVAAFPQRPAANWAGSRAATSGSSTAGPTVNTDRLARECGRPGRARNVDVIVGQQHAPVVAAEAGYANDANRVRDGRRSGRHRPRRAVWRGRAVISPASPASMLRSARQVAGAARASSFRTSRASPCCVNPTLPPAIGQIADVQEAARALGWSCIRSPCATPARSTRIYDAARERRRCAL